ncbi:helix-turn-helix transcriptional regulator [Limnohabitans sp.]|uniref:helix-turn-helix domain-containing protein n=1 Tax=Limnohabitans sp. TaxID=1907725 RepID=UPI0025BAC44E|nr:helix-turn-helix transcriptional regulator [Limnohabitans sp.]
MKNDQNNLIQRQFGLRLKELRDAKGMTQEDLAEKAELFRTYLSRIETGSANPTLTVIHQLARAVEETPSSLLEPPTIKKVPRRTRSSQPISRGRI